MDGIKNQATNLATMAYEFIITDNTVEYILLQHNLLDIKCFNC